MAKIAAIITGPDTYLDHLGVLSYIMKMPLFITEEETYSKCLLFYPQLNPIQKNQDDLDAGFLATHFDALFESGKFFTMQLAPLIELLYKKKIRCIYCPHGHSDKGHSAKSFAKQDISLVYGDHMKDLLKKTGELNSIDLMITTGNYRWAFYQKYQSFYDKLTFDLIGCKLDRSKKTAIYAPSWQDGENPTSFFSLADKLIENLKEKFNLIIKLHPFLEKFHPAETYLVLEKYKKDPNILFLTSFPCIYPLLQICDLYIGDYSSISYDFLAFNRPIYFLLPENGPVFEIHKAGLIFRGNNNLSDFIQATWEENSQENKKARETLYQYVFGEDVSLDALQKQILKFLN